MSTFNTFASTKRSILMKIVTIKTDSDLSS